MRLITIVVMCHIAANQYADYQHIGQMATHNVPLPSNNAWVRGIATKACAQARGRREKGQDEG